MTPPLPPELVPALDRLEIGLFQVDPTGTLTVWNQGAARITGRPVDEVLGKPWTSLAEIREGFGEIARLLDHPEELPEGAQPFELRFTKPDGGHLHLYGSLVARWDGPTFLGLLGEFRDITQLISRKRFARLPEPSRSTTLLGDSSAMAAVRHRIELAAKTEVTTSIRGESGTGKELAARAVHAASSRAGRPFVPINCSALTDTLLESELFGHVAGAFTGALRGHRGIFETAQGGTVFLDEIGDIGPAMQVKLLRVLEDRRVRPVGGDREIPIDVRLVTATHRDLRERMREGSFRQDFFYRIRVFEIEIPPLRARREDIPSLVGHFIEEFGARFDRPVRGVTEEALGLLLHYPWPGNVRELRNAIEHAFVTVSKDRIGIRDLPEEIRKRVNPAMAATDLEGLRHGEDELERLRILDALEECDWNRTRTAKALGISRVTLWKRMGRYGILPAARSDAQR